MGGRKTSKHFFLKSECWGQFCFNALRVGYTIPTPPGPALLCWPGEVEESLSGVLQPLRGRDSPYTLYDPICLSHWVWGMRREGISPLPMPPNVRWEMGRTLWLTTLGLGQPHFQPPDHQASSAVLPRWGVGTTFLSVAGKGEGELSYLL